MSTSQPLKRKEDIKNLENYFYQRKEYRNYLLVVMGLNTALRISDLLQIKWQDVYNKQSKDLPENPDPYDPAVFDNSIFIEIYKAFSDIIDRILNFFMSLISNFV